MKLHRLTCWKSEAIDLLSALSISIRYLRPVSATDAASLKVAITLALGWAFIGHTLTKRVPAPTHHTTEADKQSCDHPRHC